MAVAPDPNYKELGVISISLTWLGLLFLIRHWRGDRSMSFSLHAAQTKSGQLYYFGLFALTLPMLYLFITGWYIPALALPESYMYLTIVAIIGQVVAIVVPAVGGLKEKIHDLGAYTMAFTLSPLTALLAFSDASSGIKVFAITASLCMAVMVVLFFATKPLRPYYLYFQAAYVALFHLVILISAYATGPN